ncbi:hypothetical protein BJH93_05725 [Kocuria polaris]|nr:hypothetical protein [Kocuria polaris]
MGRHAASTPDGAHRPPAPSGVHAVLGWGLFAAVVVALAGPRLGLSLGASLAAGTTTAVAFTLLWLVSLRFARRASGD